MSRPERIASLLSSATEILYGIGVGDRVVAVSHECDFPAEACRKPRATWSRIDSGRSSGEIDQQVQQLCLSGGPLYELNVPLLSELAPDLIVTQAQCDVCAVRLQDVLDLVRTEPSLQKTEVIALNPAGLKDIFADIRRVGHAAGSPVGAERLLDDLRARVSAVRDRTSNLSGQRVRVACIEWTEPLMLAANWVPELVEQAGGRHDLTRSKQHSTYADWKDLIAYDPEVLIVSPCGLPLDRGVVEARQLALRPGWTRINAVRNGRVYALDGNAYLNRSGPRILDTLEILARLIHPNLFSPFSRADSRASAWSNLG